MRLDILYIILLGGFLRLYRIQDFYMFLADQGRDAVIVRRIANLSKFPLIGPPSSIGEVFLGPFYYYLIAPFMRLWNYHPVGLAVAVAVLSILALFIIFIIVKKAVSYNVAFTFVSLLATSGLLVSIGRFSWNPNLLPYASFITLSLFYAALHGRQRVLYSILFGLAFGLTFQLHHLAALLMLPVAIYFISILWKQKNMHVWTVPAISSIAFFATLTPFIWFEFRHNFLNTTNLLSLFTEQNLVSSGSYGSRLIDVVTASMEFAFGLPLSQVVAVGMLVLLLAVLIRMLQKSTHPFVLLHLIAVISLLFGLSRVNAAAIPHYFHTVYASLYFLIAYVFVNLTKTKQALISLLIIGLFFWMQFPTYGFLWGQSSRQDLSPDHVGKFIAVQTKGKWINLATFPVEFTSRDSYQYFIEYYGGSVVDLSSQEVTDTMYVLCNKQPCRVLNSQSWNIDMFGQAVIDRIFYVDDVVIYRLKHKI